MQRLAILGAGGHGRVVADCAASAGWRSIRFFDERVDAPAPGPWSVAGGLAELLAEDAGSTRVIVAIGDNRIRLAEHRRLVGAGFAPAVIIHGRAIVSTLATIGRGGVVVAGAVVNVGARLGEAVIVNSASVVEHDCVLADGVHVSPGAVLAGSVSVGAESWIGAGAVVREGTVIGSRCRIGAGAVVVGRVADGVTVVGNPARPLERRTNA